MHQSTLGARHLHQGDGAFLRQKRVQIRPEAKTLDALFTLLRIECRLFIFIQLRNLVRGQPLKGRSPVVFGRRGPGDQHDLAGQLAFPVGEILFTRHRRNDDRRAQDAVGRRGPRQRYGPQFQRPRCDHAHMRGLDPPTSAEIEGLGSDVLQAPTLEFFLRPLLGLAHGRRIGHAAADLIGQVRRGVDDLAVIEAFVGNAVDGDGLAWKGAVLGAVTAAIDEAPRNVKTHETHSFVSTAHSLLKKSAPHRSNLEAPAPSAVSHLPN